MKPGKGLKLKERFFTIEKPGVLNDIFLFRYAGTFFGLWHIDGFFLLVDNVFLDTGNPNCSTRRFTDFLKTLESDRSWIVLNTHMHEDHCGKNSLVQNVLGAEIYSPENVVDFSFVSPLMDYVWGRPRMFNYKPLDKTVYETDRGRTIEVIPTPGHSPSHVAYRILPDDVIYSGDAIPVPGRKRYITLGEDYIAEMESLKVLLPYAERGTRFVSAHHGIVKDPVSLISQRIAGMSDVAGSVLQYASEGITDVKEIGRRVFGEQEFMYRTLGTQIRCREDWTIKSILNRTRSLSAMDQE